MKSSSHSSKSSDKASALHSLQGITKKPAATSVQARKHAKLERAAKEQAVLVHAEVAQTLLDDGLEMSFPASDPVSIDANANHLTSPPDMVCAGIDHPLEPEVPSKRKSRAAAKTTAHKPK